eukprot:TRINITY_DN60733_c0_g1_i1.p1 TRINITY_DN60733_c0_g1~~TRINITY_DN60733_c0_g1_i1.p1  ORF type:complete len:267 (+),score=31.12 TRINITY_DN60733_c0_g1_i1:75-875(+)
MLLMHGRSKATTLAGRYSLAGAALPCCKPQGFQTLSTCADVVMTNPAGKVRTVSADGLASINKLLHPQRVGLLPLPLGDVPADITKALQKIEQLQPDEHQAVFQHFKPDRERYLEIIRSTGHEPHVDGGGELHTRTNAGPGGQAIEYPGLWEVPVGTEPNKLFFELHVNYTAKEDGSIASGINECFFVLSGHTIWFHQTSEGVCKVEVSASSQQGWIMLYSGLNPHGAYLPTQNELPLRILSNAIGPTTWATYYDHGSIPANPWKP